MKSHKSSNRDNDQHRDSNQNQNDSVQFKTKTNTEFDAPFGQSIDFQQAADSSHDATTQKKSIQKKPVQKMADEDEMQLKAIQKKPIQKKGWGTLKNLVGATKKKEESSASAPSSAF